ncbi:hypothetical protein C1I97_15195 [Streptomyces sp. NTH33]|uniref:DUF5677 domain-containing protein n=1 Tax=Streptomyces sp. NTH33 TaxID=1735453 RepID=UPI000DA89EDE|nr:DUF5677 domain-containing protein [Streptomyces sp. NTH33]PZH09157.1 hypothetical protein C1I97_15195 [Streptomyces sp. NTH33]
MTELADDKETAERARAAASLLLEAGDRLVASHLSLPVENYKVVLGVYSWWRLVNRTSAAVLLLVDNGYTAPEVAPLMRNIFNHAYAINWLVDNGEAAVDALASVGADEREKLQGWLDRTGWPIAAQYRAEIDAYTAANPEPVRDAAAEALHKRLKDELGNVATMLKRYGSADVYPVYKHLSGMSHTSVQTASAYLAQDASSGDVQVRSAAVDLGYVYVIQLTIALLQAAHVFSPLLDGDPLRPAVDQAIADLGLEGLQVVPTRTP